MTKFPKFNSNKASVVVIVIVAVIVLAAIAGGSYLIVKKAIEKREQAKEEELLPEENDEFANWKTYRNEEYGWEVQYPEDFTVTELGAIEEGDLGVSRRRYALSIQSPDLTAYFAVRDYDNSQGWCTGDFDVKGDSISVTGKEREKCLEPEFGGTELVGYTVLLGQNNGLFFDFSCNKKESDICDQILSTFKFFEPDEFADWKTYRNEEYGFEFKYHPEILYTEKKIEELYSPYKLNKWKNLADELNKAIVFDFQPCVEKITPTEINCSFSVEILTTQKSLTDVIVGALEIDEFYLGEPEEEPYAFIDVSDVGGSDLEAYKVFIPGMGTDLSYYVKKKDVLIIISFGFFWSAEEVGVKEEELIIQTISTFKFLEPDEFANWKTYRNEEHGWEVQYPEDWRVDGGGRNTHFTPKNIVGDFQWSINIGDPENMNMEEHINSIIEHEKLRVGESKVVHQPIEIAGFEGIIIIITNEKLGEDWESNEIIFEKGDYQFQILNGAIKTDQFEKFYKSLRFYYED